MWKDFVKWIGGFFGSLFKVAAYFLLGALAIHWAPILAVNSYHGLVSHHVEAESDKAKKEAEEKNDKELLSTGDPMAKNVLEARSSHKQAENVWKTAELNASTVGLHVSAGEKAARIHEFRDRFTLHDDFLYDDLGNQLGEIAGGRLIRVFFPNHIKPKGFSEEIILVSIVNNNGTEDRGYMRESAISDCTREEFLKREGMGNGSWWKIPSDDSKVVLNKAVKLSPGQSSEFLYYTIKERIDYHFFKPNDSVQFRAWINGEEVEFGPSGRQKCPDVNGFLRVKVQLSSRETKDQTIRFAVYKI